MCMEREWICPICHDEKDDIAYTMPCGHQFCLGCIVHWAKMRAECALCRNLIEAVSFSVEAEDDYLNCVIPHLEELPGVGS